MPRFGDKNDDFTRPELTFTDRLADDDMKQYLIDYTAVSNIGNVPVGSHIRYFSYDKDDILKFRLGGTLLNISGLPNYIVLGNGAKTWSVQTKNENKKETIFYVKLTNTQLRKEMNEIINEKEERIKHLTAQNKDLMKKN